MVNRFAMLDICNYTQATIASRNYIEGEKLINSGHVIYCGCKNKEVNKIVIVALCLQTSAIKNMPHEINGCFIFNGEKWEIEYMKCSCKAGASRKCKHVVATLMYLNRNDITGLEETSQTDLKCLWNKRKVESLEKYTPKPLAEHSEFSSIPNKQEFNVSLEIASKIEKLLLDINADNDKENALRLHRLGRHEPWAASDSAVAMEIDDNSNEAILAIITCANKATFQLDYHPVLRECCQKYFGNLSNENIFEICLNSSTSKNTWKQARQFRITGSRCYGLFTYASNKNPDWSTKARKYFYPKGFSNVYVRHGIENEPVARKVYADAKKVSVSEPGFVVCRCNPWLGYSPDGVIFSNGQPAILLEIKCPYEGKKTTAKELVKNCNFLYCDEGEYKLKTRHSYYGQIQLGMAVLNLNQAEFVIFSSCDQTFYSITVDKDTNFIKKMLSTLKLVYFEHMIHVICTDNKN